jgi:phospho-N-acetylmuramoyl-pentapeptide-transferase
MKWSPREDTPDSHLQKAGIPSMGGIGIIGAAFGIFLVIMMSLAAAWPLTRIIFGSPLLTFALHFVFPAVVVLHAFLGFIDDWSKARGNGGLLSRQKLFGQVVIAIGLVAFIIFLQPSSTSFSSRSIGDWVIAIVLVILIIGTSNAVNLTDGIDGLAAGLSVQVACFFLFVIGGIFPPLWESNSVLIFWLCLGGACLGFLAFNKYPAKVFMGDTGSLALGAALGAGAILTRTVFLLPFIGFVFFVEMFSVIFQVLYFKYTKKRTGEGKRIFRRAPLHHHFELGGWSEWRVVGTFWAVNLATSILGLVLWKMGILPRFP